MSHCVLNSDVYSLMYGICIHIHVSFSFFLICRLLYCSILAKPELINGVFNKMHSVSFQCLKCNTKTRAFLLQSQDNSVLYGQENK